MSPAEQAGVSWKSTFGQGKTAHSGNGPTDPPVPTELGNRNSEAGGQARKPGSLERPLNSQDGGKGDSGSCGGKLQRLKAVWRDREQGIPPPAPHRGEGREAAAVWVSSILETGASQTLLPPAWGS